MKKIFIILFVIGSIIVNAQIPYQNPVLPNLADPCILFHNGTYYTSGTGDNMSYDIYSSSDLIHWNKGNKIFGPRSETNVWAPDLFFNEHDGMFYLYYTVNYKIGVARCDTPDGTYVDLGYLLTNALDAHMFKDSNGSLYLYYASNTDLKVYVQPMTDAFTKSGSPKVLIRPDQTWDIPRNEAPWMIKHNSLYYLLFSGNDANSKNYAIGYATSSSPLGPFVKYAGNPIIKGGSNIFGPGSSAVVTDQNVKYWHIYHQKDTPGVGYFRSVCLDTLWFDAGGILHGNINSSIKDTIKSNDPLIEYTGRIDFSNPLSPKFSYSGVSIRACFTGTSVSIMLNDEGASNEYNVIVDGIIKRIKVLKGLNTYQIANGLTDTIHEVEIFRLTELTFGKTSFDGFLVDQGKTSVPISNQRSILIEYIGNSITCGYGNEGSLGGVFGSTTENHYLTYAAYNSRNFNARHLAVCRSGIGIYRNYGAGVTGSADCMTNYYSRMFLSDPNPIYNFQIKPDLICIDLGTNDFNPTNGGGDSAKFVDKYFSFIDTLQTRNKSADILVLLGPMLSDPMLSKIRSYLTFVVDSANKKDNGKLYFFEMSQQTAPYGIDYHPTVSQQQKNGLELTKYIMQIKDWTIIPLVLNATTANANEVLVNFNTSVIDTVKSFNGFSLFAAGRKMKIDSIYPDATVSTRLHVILSDTLAFNQEVLLDYNPDNISSADSIKLGKIERMVVSNNLTETKVASVIVSTTGTNITVYFNKPVNFPQTTSEILFFDGNGKIFQIDSLKIMSKSSLKFFIKSIVYKGSIIYLTLPAVINGQDGVKLTPVAAFKVVNSSSVISTSVKDNEFCGGIEIYPNPASQKAIHYKINENVQGSITAELFDLQGKTVFYQSLQSTEGTIDLQNVDLKSGSYVLKINGSNKTFRKIIIL